jgi:predicted permease
MPPILKNLFAGLRALVRKRETNREMDEELRAYIESAAEAKMRAGVPPDEALRAARLEMGSAEAVKEEIRDAGWERVLESLWQDVRYGARMLRKSPGFTIVIILTLTLGIGANCAIFSIVNWLILRPLPISQPKQMTFLAFARGGSKFDNQFSSSELLSIREQSKGVFSAVSGLAFGGSLGGYSGPDGLTVDGTTSPVTAVYVTGNFFSMLGIRPHLGRLLLPSETADAGADPVVVLSYRYWQTRFHGDPSIVGKQAAINGHSVTIVGIGPRDFLGITPIIDMQAYLPLGMAPIAERIRPDLLGDPKARILCVLARVGSHTSMGQVQAAVGVIGERLAKQFPRPREETRLVARPLHPPGFLNGGDPLPVLSALFLTLAALVLLLAGVNVVNLLLVRASVRGREMAVRAALGAGRGRLVRQLLAESFLLAAGGGIGGFGFGLLAARTLRSIPLHTDVPLAFDLPFDWRVFAYTFGVALVAGLLVGIVPALRATRSDPTQVLHEGGRGSTGGRERLRGALVAAQICGALALLSIAGLFIRSLESMRHADLGFDPSHVLNLTVDPNQIGYTQAQGQAFFRTLLERVRAMPGVISASLVRNVPLGDDSSAAQITVPGYNPSPGQQFSSVQYNVVSTDYFRTMGMRLLRGRDFTDADNMSVSSMAVINQAMAARFWPGGNPLGRTFALANNSARSFTIVGVVNNSRTDAIFGSFQPVFFQPLAQHYSPVMTLQIRSAVRPEAMAGALVRLIEETAPSMPVFGIRTMVEALESPNGLLVFELGAEIVASLGLLGLILAVVGVYGVVSYAASQRTREIGIRMAFGARPPEIFRMMYRRTGWVLVAGMSVGLALSSALARLSAGFLVGVKPLDPLTFVTVTAVMALVAMAACYVPARRAMRIDPMEALRHE